MSAFVVTSVVFMVCAIQARAVSSMVAECVVYEVLVAVQLLFFIAFGMAVQGVHLDLVIQGEQKVAMQAIDPTSACKLMDFCSLTMERLEVEVTRQDASYLEEVEEEAVCSFHVGSCC